MIAAYTMHRRHRFMVIDALSSSRLSVSKAWYTHTIVSLSTYCRSRCLVTSHRLHKPWGWLIARNESYPLSRATQTRPSYSLLGCWWWWCRPWWREDGRDRCDLAACRSGWRWSPRPARGGGRKARWDWRMIYRQARSRFAFDWWVGKWKSSGWWLTGPRTSALCIWSRRSVAAKRRQRRPGRRCRRARRRPSRSTRPVCNHTIQSLDSVLRRKRGAYIGNCRCLRPTGAFDGPWSRTRVSTRRTRLCIGTDSCRGPSLCYSGNFWLNTCIGRVRGVLQFHNWNTSDPPTSSWCRPRCQP